MLFSCDITVIEHNGRGLITKGDDHNVHVIICLSHLLNLLFLSLCLEIRKTFISVLKKKMAP